jgi:hypothetical protein
MMKGTYWKLLGQLLKAPRENPKKSLTKEKNYGIIRLERKG